MPQILLIRPGCTDFDEQHRIQGTLDLPLSPRGEKQVAKLVRGMQDVAIDALAVNSLAEHERGLANGLMFAGAAIGQAIGGAGVLFLSSYTGFQPTFFFVAGCILAVKALYELQRIGGRYALVTMCIGGGQGIAALFEKI